MTHFRFRYHQYGFMRWRCRRPRLRALRLVSRLNELATQLTLGTTGAHRILGGANRPSRAAILQIGKFIVSQEGDPQLHGHPDIRY